LLLLRLTDETGGVPRRAVSQLQTLEQDDVALPAFDEVIRDAAADDAAADDDDLLRAGTGMGSLATFADC
jgi:hypothetical protein